MTEDDSWFEKDQLHFAARDGNLEKARELLSAGSDVNAFDGLSMTPLHYAAEAGFTEMMMLLLKSGADPNAHESAKLGNTPLREIASECTFEVAKVLIDAGSDPSIPGWMQITALDLSGKRLSPEGKRVHSLLLDAINQRKK